MIKAHVMHVPGEGRDSNVENLRKAFSKPGFGFCLHKDEARHGVVYNWASVVTCMRKDPDTWAVQLNDDAVLLNSTMWNLPNALFNSPRKLLGLAWSGIRRGSRAIHARVPYAVGPYLLHGLAVGYHHSVLEPLSVFANAAVDSGYENDDILLSVWAQRFSDPVFLPALVGRTLFGTLQTPSLLGRATYMTPPITVDDAVDNWKTREFIRDNYLGRREDEAKVVEMMRSRLR